MTSREAKRIEERFCRHINRGQVAYLKAGHLDLIESEREGVHFLDSVSGRRMIDCFSSAGSFNVSRHNPVIVEALEEALDAGYDMGSFDLLSVPKLELAKKLVDIAPDGLQRILFAAPHPGATQRE